MDFDKLPSIDKFLRDKGIDVYYNTLGATDGLIQSFVKETEEIVDRSPAKTSHFVKNECYSLYYDFEPREKLTGFEYYNDLYISARLAAQERFASVQFSPTMLVEKKTTDTQISYKEQLIDFCRHLPEKEILIYLSGGVDSEFVASALIDSGREFTPVIYRYLDSSGAVTNINDIEYAYRFCQKHDVQPILRDIRIESLWASEEFLQLMQESKIESAQLVTHIYMCMQMNDSIPDSVHLFGGEIRYRTNYLLDDGESTANLVILGKVTPGFNGQTYTNDNPQSVGPYNTSLTFYSDGTWGIMYFKSFSGTFTGSPLSGTWAVAPLNPAGYEYRIPVVNANAGGGDSFAIPELPDPNWYPITVVTDVANTYAHTEGLATGAFAVTQFTMEIRPVGQTSVVTASITIGTYIQGI